MSAHQPESSTLESELRARDSKKKRGIVITAVIGIAAIAAVVIFLVLNQRSSGSADADGDLIELKIADSAQSDFQDTIVEVGREKGLDIEFVNFDDPYLPNTALLNGEVDGNVFQHVAWLSQFNQENDADLQPVFSTVVTYWGLFSSSAADVDQIADGARIAVPDDPANFSRALFILQTAGLLTVDENAGVFPTEEDITDNPHDIELVRLAHESVQTAYEDPTIAAVVTAVDDFDPSLEITPEDALVVEDPEAPSSRPYVIVTATTPDRVDDPEWKPFEETYRDQRVIDALEEEKRGQAQIVEIPAEDLRTALDELDEQ